MDKLEHIFELQKNLNERIGVKTDGMNEEDQIKWTLNYCRALSQEIAELIDSVPWKWWAKYQKFDKQNARVEIVDMFHFLVSAAQVLGLTADDIYNGYIEKNKVNHARQENGYTKKDESDNKAIFQA